MTQPKKHSSGTLNKFLVVSLTLLSIACAKRGPAIHDDPNLTPAQRQELIEAQEKADALAAKVKANAEVRKKEQALDEKRMRSGYAVAKNSEDLMRPISVDVVKNGQNATADFFISVFKDKGREVTIIQILDKKITREQFEKGEGQIAAFSIGKNPFEALREYWKNPKDLKLEESGKVVADGNATVIKTPEKPNTPDQLTFIQKRQGTSGWGSLEQLGNQ